jgi:hypothetical protein
VQVAALRRADPPPKESYCLTETIKQKPRFIVTYSDHIIIIIIIINCSDNQCRWILMGGKYIFGIMCFFNFVLCEDLGIFFIFSVWEIVTLKLGINAPLLRTLSVNIVPRVYVQFVEQGWPRVSPTAF